MESKMICYRYFITDSTVSLEQEETEFIVRPLEREKNSIYTVE